MAYTTLNNKYFVRKDQNAEWEDIAVKFDGVKVLSISGFNEQGKSTSIYAEQWIDEQAEDVMVVTQDDNGEDVVVRENVDLSLTFIVGEKYATKAGFDTQTAHDAFINYMCNKGALYVRSAYTNKVANVICLKAYKPTTERLHRHGNSYIMGTITLHTIDAPWAYNVDSDGKKPWQGGVSE